MLVSAQMAFKPESGHLYTGSGWFNYFEGDTEQGSERFSSKPGQQNYLLRIYYCLGELFNQLDKKTFEEYIDTSYNYEEGNDWFVLTQLLYISVVLTGALSTTLGRYGESKYSFT